MEPTSQRSDRETIKKTWYQWNIIRSYNRRQTMPMVCSIWMDPEIVIKSGSESDVNNRAL